MNASLVRRLRSAVGNSGFHLKDILDRRVIEAFYRRNPVPISHGAPSIVVCEGMWDNPNHWFRLWLYFHALLADRSLDVVAVLRSRRDFRQRTSLRAIGVRRFLFLEDAKDESGAFRAEAQSLLRNVTSAKEMLSLELPNGYPAYAYFDTVVKIEKQPQPRIQNNGVWLNSLIDVFRMDRFYQDLFDENDVQSVISSHPWKNEFALLCWTALKRKIPFSYITAHYSSVRIRRMSSPDDYRAPNEHQTFEEFSNLPATVRERLVERGRDYMEDRFNGASDFVVSRYAINPELRHRNRDDLLIEMGLDPAKPVAVIYAHSWFDFAHAQDMRNFTDPLDWMLLTIDTIAQVAGVNWIIKPHPCDKWYGVLGIHDLIEDLPADHLAILEEPSDSLAVQNAADVLVTIHGSVGIEGPAHGKPVLCADRSYYSNWCFTHTARSREHYVEMLEDITGLVAPSGTQSEFAMAYGATALGPPPDDCGYLNLPCDSLYIERDLYWRLEDICQNHRAAVDREIDTLRHWIASPANSYNVWRTVQHYENCHG